ncbi:MAG TPA: PepSY domain-containing protein [Luteibacter sp.]|jgi:hypothetical protein|nr:PepSY domain-containing protein [Luteibacter sp.]
MKHHAVSVIFALALGASGVVAAQEQAAMTEPQVQAKLTDQGYTKVHDLKFKNGMWEAQARSANGKSVDLRIDPKSGQVYPDSNKVSRMSEKDVRAALAAQGYTHVHDVDFDDGMWKAKAENPSGNDVKLKLDPQSGKVVGVE